VRATVEGRSPQSIANTGLLAIVLYIVAALHPVLLGYAMNDLWDAARERAGQGSLPQLTTGAAV
jgi:hypothetical protein